MVATKLYVGNIPDDHDRKELENLFRKYGNVVEFDILKDYGFVHYDQESEARSAADALDGHIHRGANLKVEVSRSQVRQKPGMGGRGECYRCGGDGHWSKECPRGPTRSRGRGRGGDSRNGGAPGGRFRRGPYDDPYYPDPYDYYSRRPPPPHPYERFRYDPYERRLPPVPPPRDYYPYPRPPPEYYRRSPPPRDPYYDYYERRSGGGVGGGSSGPSSSAEHDTKPPLIRNQIQSRVPGPY